MLNVFLQEAVEKSFNPAPYCTEIKKVLNTCQLTKFKAKGECAKFYSAFFCNQVEDELTFDQWCLIYNTLLYDDKICSLITSFITMYQPKEYTGMFTPLIHLIDSESANMRENKVRYLSNAKAFFNFLQMKMDAITTPIRVKIVDTDVTKFVTTIMGVLNTHIFYLNNLIHRAMEESYDKDDIVQVIHTPLSEDAKSLLEMFTKYEEFENVYVEEAMNEAVVKKAVEKAKELNVAQKKAGKAFDEMIMKKVKSIRENRRNRKHAEMVGEALRINHELKRLLGSLALGALNPALGVITWVVSVVYDRATDKKDRDILVGQLKDELEIVEEKISQAERNGDDKAKIELMRIRQRLTKEYQRVNRIRYDDARQINKLNR